MSTPPPAEGFQPRAHWAPDTPLRPLLLTLRLTADLQTNTIYRDLRRELAGFSGRLPDIGCGNSPFRPLLDAARTHYQDIDVERAANFGYRNPDTVYYDGKTIPFADNLFDAALCNEVLEHVPEPGTFVSEMHRVLKPGGLALVTLPWSARFHYQSYVYHRYTPTIRQQIFAPFRECSTRPRVTDFSSIASKTVVAYVRNLLRQWSVPAAGWLLLPFSLIAAVLGLLFLLVAQVRSHAGILFGLVSTDDPLGYTVVLKK